MSSRIPQCRPKKLERVLFRAGFHLTSTDGSHRYYANNGRDTCIAFHSRDVPRETLKKILKQAGISEEQFHNLLRGKRAA